MPKFIIKSREEVVYTVAVEAVNMTEAILFAQKNEDKLDWSELTRENFVIEGNPEEIK